MKENEIIKVDEGQLIIGKQTIEKIKELELRKKEIDNIEKDLKDKLREVMSNNDITKYISNDETLKISCTPETISMIFDQERFCKEHHDLYVDYLIERPRKASLRITVKEEK